MTSIFETLPKFMNYPKPASGWNSSTDEIQLNIESEYIFPRNPVYWVTDLREEYEPVDFGRLISMCRRPISDDDLIAVSCKSNPKTKLADWAEDGF